MDDQKQRPLFPEDPAGLDLEQLQALVRSLVRPGAADATVVPRLLGREGLARVRVVALLDEIGHRLQTPSDDSTQAILMDLQGDLTRWLLEDSRSRKPRDPFGGGLCMCSTGDGNDTCELPFAEEEGGVPMPPK